MTSVTFAAAALFLFFRGAQGHGITAAGDITAPIDFIRNPAGAIVESAIDEFGQRAADRKTKAAEEQQQPAFDADAAIARYLANRPEPLPSAAEPAAPPRPQFGRKGL